MSIRRPWFVKKLAPNDRAADRSNPEAVAEEAARVLAEGDSQRTFAVRLDGGPVGCYEVSGTYCVFIGGRGREHAFVGPGIHEKGKTGDIVPDGNGAS